MDPAAASMHTAYIMCVLISRPASWTHAVDPCIGVTEALGCTSSIHRSLIGRNMACTTTLVSMLGIREHWR
jgi:hypothetical protein